jgi:hypothetical protein
MLPLVLSPPAGKPARVLGAGKEILPYLQNLVSVNWPVVLHEPASPSGYQGMKGLQFSTSPPAAPSLRQASLVLISIACPDGWRDAARRDLEGSGVPVWDARDAKGSTLSFPIWFPGSPLSMACWSTGKLEPWEAALAEDYLRETQGVTAGFLRLASELRQLVFEGATDDEFRKKVVAQLTQTEILQFLLRGDYEQAKVLALKIIGTTTRSLE